MSILPVPETTIPRNEAHNPRPPKQALIVDVDYKVKSLGTCVAAHREHIITLYKEHNNTVEHINASANKMLRELNANLIKTLLPEISEAAKAILEKDPELIRRLAEAVIIQQQKTIDQYEGRLKTLEKKVEELTVRAKL
ncbi:MAG: hypothetical protein H7A38_00280 [Chlamydiales bacterium]|nr:hypothetical protein [Chlamydiales bacterium]